MTTLSEDGSATKDVSGHFRPTMREVAALSGASLKTVSRVINNEGGVSEVLVERVLKAAKVLDYHRNLSASSLRRNDGKTKTIGLLLEDVSNPFSSALHRAIEDVARPRDVIVFAGSLDEDPTRERELASAFAARRVDGLIVVPAGTDQSYLLTERRAGTAIVFVDRPPSLFDADTVVATNREGSRQATAHLIQYGHRRIAYIGDFATIYTGAERLAGYTEALEFERIPVKQTLIRQGHHSSESAYQTLMEMLSGADRPTAIFASQNFVTIGAIRALRECGLQHEIALVGFDDLPLADLLDPPVTMVTQDVSAMGALAAELLFRRLDGDAGPSQHHVLATTLIPRGSGEIRPL